jgi:ParB-like chromosome segregation protein Spo0J
MDNPTLEQVLPKQEDIQLVDINLIKPHPKNYKKHPQDQLEHICKSIRENGIYRNILIANDNIILAGHGVYEACKNKS